MTEYIYQNFKGFFQAGKSIPPPKNHLEKRFSTTLAGLVLFVTTGLLLWFFFFGPTQRIQLKALLLVSPSVTLVALLFKGVSISELLKGTLRYWIPTTLLLQIVFTSLFAIYMLVEKSSINTMNLVFGSQLISFGFFGAVFSFKHAQHLKHLNQTGFREKAMKVGTFLYGLIWLGFLGGGLILFFFDKIDRWVNS